MVVNEWTDHLFQSAGIGDCAHLVNFVGTDTVAGLMVARTYYNCDMAGYSTRGLNTGIVVVVFTTV